MLTKVIDDEDKLQNRMESVETISPLKDCVTTPYDKYKSTYNFPCVQGTKQDYKTKPRKNTKFTKTENLDILDRKTEKQNDAQLLQCPSCGWEDVRPNRLSITAKKTYEQIKPLDIAVPCPEYSNFADKSYEGYKAHRYRTDTIYQGKYNNIIPCPSFPSSLPSYTDYPEDILTTHCPQGNYINQQMTPGPIITSKSKSCTREIQLPSEQLFPEKRTKQVGTSVEQHDKGIQNTVCMSKTKTDVIGKCYREIQSKPLTSQEELKQVAVNTAQQCDKEIQNTIYASPSNCQASQKYSSTRKAKQIDTNTVECPANDMRNTIGIKLKSVGGSVPNFILITTDRNYLPLIQRDWKELTTNKCQKDSGDYDQKGVEKAYLELDDKKLVENEVCVKETCSSDIMEIIKENSVITQVLLQCLEKVMQERTKICSVTSLLSNRDNVNSNSSEMIACEQIPSKYANENIHFGSSSAVELESPSCLSCLEKPEEDNTVTMFIKTCLELIRHALELNSKNVQESCIRKEDEINTFIVLNKIKEYADEILKIYTLVDYSKRQLLNNFYSRSKSKSESPSKQNSTLNSVQTQDTKEDAAIDPFTASFANSKNVEVLYRPSISQVRDHSLSKNGATYAETMTEELFVKDKDITARTENHDIGLNVSLPQISLRESGTQYTPKQLQDTGIVTDPSFEEKISVATQNREPMLIRVIKSNNSEGILKLDKETCVRDAHVFWMANVDKCSKNMYHKYSVREYDKLLHPGVSYVREKEVNCIDYRTSLLPKRIYGYNKRCKSSLPCNHDWTKANLRLLSNQRISKIPLYAKSRKYTRRRTELYRMSQSYV
ncbi:uncharacterized protein [Temnothorax nylanderi]|uniref:uncharacterized protein n=1 Tax=Temnothorax nylanderi TaxID=102681 RepID=UPI003A8802EB